jgi:hypothetical protein
MKKMICPKCKNFMVRYKKVRHYWKCQERKGGCGKIIKWKEKKNDIPAIDSFGNYIKDINTIRGKG